MDADGVAHALPAGEDGGQFVVVRSALVTPSGEDGEAGIELVQVGVAHALLVGEAGVFPGSVGAKPFGIIFAFAAIPLAAATPAFIKGAVLRLLSGSPFGIPKHVQPIVQVFLC